MKLINELELVCKQKMYQQTTNNNNFEIEIPIGTRNFLPHNFSESFCRDFYEQGKVGIMGVNPLQNEGKCPPPPSSILSHSYF